MFGENAAIWLQEFFYFISNVFSICLPVDHVNMQLCWSVSQVTLWALYLSSIYYQSLKAKSHSYNYLILNDDELLYGTNDMMF